MERKWNANGTQTERKDGKIVPNHSNVERNYKKTIDLELLELSIMIEK